MRFNGKDITSYWKAKAIKFDTSYYSAFDRQEVKFRGLLLSYLEVPTVRKITVDILIKDRDKYLLDKTIREMSEWLIDSGEAKLFCDRNPNQYFIARCTYISNPEFAGHSAKLTIEFTCSDYRPYDFITNNPIGNVTESLSNFTFDGKHCLNDMKCLFVIESYNLIPKVNRNVYHVSGRSGTVYYDNQTPTLEERSIVGTMYFLKSDGSTQSMTPEEIDERAHKVASWLVCAGRKPLTFDSSSNLAVDAEFCEPSDVSYDKWINGSVSLKITLQPYFYEKTARSVSGTIEVPANTYVFVNLTSEFNPIGFTTPLNVSVQTSADITSLNFGTYMPNNKENHLILQDNGFVLSPGQTLIVDSANFDIKIGNTDALKYIKSGDFPVIMPNIRKYLYFRTTSATTITYTISINARWL